MKIPYNSCFEKTDISRQLKESNVPQSAYLYVEQLWNRQKELNEKRQKAITALEDYVIDLDDILSILR